MPSAYWTPSPEVVARSGHRRMACRDLPPVRPQPGCRGYLEDAIVDRLRAGRDIRMKARRIRQRDAAHVLRAGRHGHPAPRDSIVELDAQDEGVALARIHDEAQHGARRFVMLDVPRHPTREAVHGVALRRLVQRDLVRHPAELVTPAGDAIWP